MQMKFHQLEKRQVAAHAAMNYYYRPAKLEPFCYYQFISETNVISRGEATKSQQEYFEFLEDHPLQAAMVVVYRQRPCIPIFAWNWLGSTKKFEKPMTEIANNANIDYDQKEEYAYKFMILFLPIRHHSDLMIDGSYQEGWLHAFHNDWFTEEMIEIAENIQTIHNSLESSIPTNSLTSGTTLTEEEENAEDNRADGDMENDLLVCIGELFASTTGGTALAEDAQELSPIFKTKYAEKMFPVADITSDKEILKATMESVIQFHEPGNTNQREQSGVQNTERFRTTLSELNSLFNMCVITRSDENVNEVESNEKKIINATGSCESIQLWGENEKLDLEQQTAFEIVIASYVLTFYNEAMSNRSIRHDDIDYIKRTRDLHTLARRSNPRSKLRMFVTGPAGAGKCKNQNCYST